MRLAATLIALFLMHGNAMALSAQELQQQCREALRSWDNPGQRFEPQQSGLCLGYLAGIAEANLGFSNLVPSTLRLCLPNGITVSQMVRVYLAHIDARPQDLHFNAANVVLEAYLNAFPCRDQPAAR